VEREGDACGRKCEKCETWKGRIRITAKRFKS